MAPAGGHLPEGVRPDDVTATTTSAGVWVVRHLRSGLLIRVSADEGDRASVVVHGEVDLDCAGTLELVLLDRVARGLDVDLSDVGFIDCAGLNALLRVQARAHAVGTAVELARVSPAVARMLRLTGCWTAFPPVSAAAPSVPQPPAPPAARPA
jgi:anti-anti-sigma factor